MEKLIKSTLGQWKIIAETELKKAWVKDPKDSSGAKRFNAAYPTLSGTDIAASKNNIHKQNRHILNGLFSSLNSATQSGNTRQSDQAKGAIKNHVLSQNPGDIDLGHLSQHKEKQAIGASGKKPFHNEDMSEFITHHLKDAKSLKDIHDNHGGVGAIEGLMRHYGSGNNYYSSLKIHPRINADIAHLIHADGGIGGVGYEHESNNGLKPSEYHNSIGKIKDKHEQEVSNTFNEAIDADPESDSWMKSTHHPLWKKHEDAVVKRGLEVFKDHHKL